MSEADRTGLYERVVAHLFNCLGHDQPYVKNHHIITELECSTKRAGYPLAEIERDDPRLELERRGGTSNGTT